MKEQSFPTSVVATESAEASERSAPLRRAQRHLPRIEPLRDTFGRTASYLRLSVTSACTMRCEYCQPDGASRPASQPESLTIDEMECLAAHLARRHGVSKLRLTGGEPTAHPEILSIVRRLAAIDEIDHLAMTTNGLTLARQAQDLAKAGLQSVNISLDSLDPERFRRITGVDALGTVLKGIEASQSARLHPIKINTVALRGRNDEDLAKLIRFAAERDMEIRFIELMPKGRVAASWEEGFLPGETIFENLGEAILSRELLPQNGDTARRWRLRLSDGLEATVGLITPVSHSFCGHCNRIRIMSDGALHTCLLEKAAASLLPALRPVFDPDALERILAQALPQKARAGSIQKSSEPITCTGG